MRNLRVTTVLFAIAMLPLLAGCGGSDPEIDKSIADVRTSVQHLREAIKDEDEAVKARTADAKEQIENVQLVAQIEHTKLEKYAQRAPAKTQDFADAAENWASTILTARTAILEQVVENLGSAAIANSYMAEDRMDEEAKKLGVTPWTPRKG
ncbi:hypothetical protein ABZY10_29330 [Streptomyces sp. NPDC006539]|uniref:hypothetical protein n=1 Tax=Streptomyces sp. NPDC006539 TaxID=3155352 RepID=UPI0033B92572